MENILVMKSSSRAYSSLKSRLRDQYSEAKIDVLVTSEPGQAVEAEPEKGEAIVVEEGQFDLSALSEAELENLQQTGYDLVVVLYNDIYEFGYGNVEKLARAVKPGRIRGADAYDREWKLNLFNRCLLFFARVLKKPAILILDILTIIFILVYFVPALLWRYLKRTVSSSN